MKKIICLSLLLFPIVSIAQLHKRKNDSKVYNFSEVWVWEYEHTDGTKGEMAIYREPKLNYWLLTADDAGFRNTDEMSLWFILKPSGEIIQAYQDGDESSRKKLALHRVHPTNKMRIPHYWKSTGKTKKFGNPDLGFPYLTGKEYTIHYEKTNDKSVTYLGNTSADFGTLALFNNLNIDAKLPVKFPEEIPRNLIPLSEKVTFVGGRFEYTFKYISPTEFHINLSEYNPH